MSTAHEDKNGPLAVIEVKPGRYFVAIWFLANRAHNPTQDYLAAVYKDEGDEGFSLTYRFRNYDGNGKMFDSGDTKSIVHATIKKESEPRIEAVIDEAINELITKSDYTGLLTKLVLHTSDTEAIGRRILSLPFAHAKSLSKEKRG